MASPHVVTFTPDLLRSYTEAAMDNANELLAEASLLLAHGHKARAYFLAVAAIEEAGKGLQAFDGQNRNLADPAVVTNLKRGMEDHSRKITYAFMPWILASKDTREALKASVDLMIHLKRGREPSMYSDLRTEPDRAQRPRDIVREEAARDCVRLASDCLAHAVHHVREKQPQLITRAMEKLFTMKHSHLSKMLNTADFWWYYLARREAGDAEWADAIVGYDREHLQPGTLFKNA
jgi:AbiV family abortive infection protein